MTSPPATTTVAQQEASARAACPGWDIWASRGLEGPTTWSVRPTGALVAVKTGLESAEAALRYAVTYEANIAEHVAETRARIAAVEMSSIGADERRVLGMLLAAQEAIAFTNAPAERDAEARDDQAGR